MGSVMDFAQPARFTLTEFHGRAHSLARACTQMRRVPIAAARQCAVRAARFGVSGGMRDAALLARARIRR